MIGRQKKACCIYNIINLSLLTRYRPCMHLLKGMEYPIFCGTSWLGRHLKPPGTKLSLMIW
jgi:hypothetical protein